MRCCNGLAAILVVRVAVFFSLRQHVVNIQDTCAIVTGASKGVGFTIAERLTEVGVTRLAMVARNRDTLDTARADLARRRPGVNVVAVAADVSNATSRSELMEEVERTFGACDILVNNAAVFRPGHMTRVSAETIDNQIDTNLRSVIHLTRAFLPAAVARGRGHVVSVSSTLSKTGLAYAPVYTATKAAINTYMRSLRAEMRRMAPNVTAHVVIPGAVKDTGVMLKLYKIDMLSALWSTFGYCESSDVADAVVQAIQYDVPEIYINSPPFRPLAVLHTVFPRIFDYIPVEESILAANEGLADDEAASQ